MKLTIRYADANLDESYGLAEDEHGNPLVFVSENADPSTARAISASEGDHFIAASGACGLVRESRVVACPSGPACDKIAVWPGPNAPVFEVEQEENVNI